MTAPNVNQDNPFLYIQQELKQFGPYHARAQLDTHVSVLKRTENFDSGLEGFASETRDMIINSHIAMGRKSIDALLNPKPKDSSDYLDPATPRWAMYEAELGHGKETFDPQMHVYHALASAKNKEQKAKVLEYAEHVIDLYVKLIRNDIDNAGKDGNGLWKTIKQDGLYDDALRFSDEIRGLAREAGIRLTYNAEKIRAEFADLPGFGKRHTPAYQERMRAASNERVRKAA